MPDLAGRTPIDNALEIAEGFSESWHLISLDGGHDERPAHRDPGDRAGHGRFLSGQDPEAKRREILIGGGR